MRLPTNLEFYADPQGLLTLDIVSGPSSGRPPTPQTLASGPYKLITNMAATGDGTYSL